MLQIIVPSMKPISSERRRINGEWVKALRESLGINQHELADALGVSRSAVARWELKAFRPSQLAAKALIEFAARSREAQGVQVVGKGTPLNRPKRRESQQSQRRSRHAQTTAGPKS
jgi:DNA-binding XRE family transcriptional regulator